DDRDWFSEPAGEDEQPPTKYVAPVDESEQDAHLVDDVDEEEHVDAGGTVFGQHTTPIPAELIKEIDQREPEAETPAGSALSELDSPEVPASDSDEQLQEPTQYVSSGLISSALGNKEPDTAPEASDASAERTQFVRTPEPEPEPARAEPRAAEPVAPPAPAPGPQA